MTTEPMSEAERIGLAAVLTLSAVGIVAATVKIYADGPPPAGNLPFAKLAAVLVAAAVLGLLPAVIAKIKGYGFLAWWLLGAVCFVVFLPWSLLLRSRR